MKAQIPQAACVALMFSLLSLGSATASAQRPTDSKVSESLSSREAYVGVPITLSVEIANATSHDPPVIPEIDGVRIEPQGTPSRSSQTTIINGRRSDRVSVTYAWRVTPKREGRFVIPSIDVNVDDRTERTRPLPFVVTRSETGDLLFAEVTGARDAIYVGQALPVTLNIWVKPFRDAERGVTLSEADMWQFVSEDPTSLGIFGERIVEMSQNRQRPSGREVLRADSTGTEHSYYFYEIETTIYPKRPGAIDVDDVQVVVSYPTGLGRSRDLFSMFEQRLRVTSTRPIVAEASVADIDVLPVPQEQRPADYRGAVGRYDIVTQASPTQIKAGDPITLQIGIFGDGPLDLVQAPPLAELSKLTENFRVPQESLAGIVENNVKVFTVDIRPRQEGITEIPAIPLSYFDPETAEFVTVRSAPIPIQVDAAATLELTSVVGNARATGGDESDASAVVLSFANAADSTVLQSRSPWPIWPVALILLAGPLAFAGTLVVRRLWLSESGWAGVRWRRPLSVARRAVADARTPHEVGTTLLSYIGRQLNVAADSLTRSEAIFGLRQQGTVAGLDELDELLAECEQATYAPLSITNMRRLKEQGLLCLALINERPSIRTPSSHNSIPSQTLVAS